MTMHGRTVQAGFSLVELLVALAISAVLLLGLTNIFVSSSQSRDVQNAMSDIHETGRFASDQLARHLRMTGARTSNWHFGPIPGALAATDGLSDTLTVVYQDTLDCNLDPAPVGGFVTNVFDVVGDSLRCNGLELIDGVQELQVFLGEDLDGDGVANRLLPPGTPGLQMNRVVSVNLNLLVVSRADRVGVRQPVLSNDFWNTVPATDDRRIWREYSTTVSMRNLL